VLVVVVLELEAEVMLLTLVVVDVTVADGIPVVALDIRTELNEFAREDEALDEGDADVVIAELAETVGRVEARAMLVVVEGVEAVFEVKLPKVGMEKVVLTNVEGLRDELEMVTLLPAVELVKPALVRTELLAKELLATEPVEAALARIELLATELLEAKLVEVGPLRVELPKTTLLDVNPPDIGFLVAELLVVELLRAELLVVELLRAELLVVELLRVGLLEVDPPVLDLVDIAVVAATPVFCNEEETTFEDGTAEAFKDETAETLEEGIAGVFEEALGVSNTVVRSKEVTVTVADDCFGGADRLNVFT